VPAPAPRIVLPALRIAVGAGALAAPQLIEPVLGLKMRGDAAALFMARLFGARDVLLGVGALTAGPAGPSPGDPGRQPAWRCSAKKRRIRPQASSALGWW